MEETEYGEREGVSKTKILVSTVKKYFKQYLKLKYKESVFTIIFRNLGMNTERKRYNGCLWGVRFRGCER